MKDERFHIKVTKALKDRVVSLASRTRRTVTSIIEQAIEEFLSRHE